MDVFDLRTLQMFGYLGYMNFFECFFILDLLASLLLVDINNNNYDDDDDDNNINKNVYLCNVQITYPANIQITLQQQTSFNNIKSYPFI